MAGSTFLQVQDISLLQGVDWLEFETWDHFPLVELDHMMTLDFAVMLQGKQVAFTNQEPIFWDAEGGMAVMKINSEALSCLLSWSDPIDPNCQDDFLKFILFLESQGIEGIYEVATF